MEGEGKCYTRGASAFTVLSFPLLASGQSASQRLTTLQNTRIETSGSEADFISSFP